MVRDLPEVQVEGDSPWHMEKAIKKFKIVTGPLLREFKKRTEYWRKPSVKKREKREANAKRKAVERRKAERNGNQYKRVPKRVVRPTQERQAQVH